MIVLYLLEVVSLVMLVDMQQVPIKEELNL